METKTADINIDEFLSLPLEELIARANSIRKNFLGNKLELCSIFNAKSGLCGEDCGFCAQSARNDAGISTYPLKSGEEIFEAAGNAKKIGAERFGIVTSGNRLTAKELDTVAKAISRINDEVRIDVCLSAGALVKQEFKILKQAGLRRYHHNIETSERFYPRIVTTHRFRERIDTIVAAKEAGLEVCSGGIIGMGEDWRDRMDMACLLRKLEVDAVPLNILVPLKGTAFEGMRAVPCVDIIKTFCLFRIIISDKVIKIAAGRETVLKDFQALVFMAGANGMLIGGYLTVRGREHCEDSRLIEEVKELWKG